MAGALAFFAVGKPGTAVLLLVLAAGIGVIATLRPPAWLLNIGAAGITLQAWVSALGWIGALPQLDTLAHFSSALLAGLVLAAPLGQAAGLAAFVLGVLWELYEWGSDALLGTDMSLGRRDTITDLAAVGAAAILATVLTSAGAKPDDAPRGRARRARIRQPHRDLDPGARPARESGAEP